MKWWQVSIILCVYGYFKEFRPSEPFITPFLKEKGFTSEEINQKIYPIGTYSYLALLIFVFLLTDFLRYKPVIIAGGLFGIVTWSMLAWCKELPAMQALEFFYGAFAASEVAYFTYMYAKVDKSHYQKVTSHTRTAFLLGRSGSGICSQLLISFNAMNYLQLHYLTISALIIATICSLCLPSVPSSVYFHRTTDPGTKDNGSDTNVVIIENEILEKPKVHKKYTLAFQFLFKDFVEAFTNKYVLKWSIWWALATCGYLQVASYSQILWQEIIQVEDEKQDLYYGYVEFVYTLLGAVMAFAIGFLNIQWEVYGELVLAVISLLQGGCELYSSYLTKMIPAYLLYVIFGMLYQAAITIASSEVAKNIREDSYALVFGVNTFFALLLQALLTAIVIDACKASIRTQFLIYGSYYLLIGAGFSIAAIVSLFKFYRNKSS